MMNCLFSFDESCLDVSFYWFLNEVLITYLKEIWFIAYDQILISDDFIFA